jgi:biotin operon repressor
MTPAPTLVARVVRALRRRTSPVSGERLARQLGVTRLRSIGEAAREARLRGLGVSYVSGKGYVMARSRAERQACADRMERAAKAELRAARALRRGRSRQVSLPPPVRRRAA